jgi:hypothetical protein
VTLATLTDKERADLLRRVAVALGLEPDEVEPERLVAVATDAREARDAARWRWSSIKLGPS